MDLFVYFERSELICVLLLEIIEIIYLLAKFDTLNEKLNPKVTVLEDDFALKENCEKVISYRKMIKATTTLYMIIVWNGVIMYSVEVIFPCSHMGCKSMSNQTMQK